MTLFFFLSNFSAWPRYCTCGWLDESPVAMQKEINKRKQEQNLEKILMLSFPIQHSHFIQM